MAWQVIQLCQLLQLSCISVIPAGPAAQAAADRLRSVYGATHVFEDGEALPDKVADCGLPQPRLALDAVGGRAGGRLARTLRAECPLVVHGLGAATPPVLDDAVAMHGQVSVHGFLINEWVSAQGKKAYLKMLGALAKLVKANKLTVEGACKSAVTAHSLCACPCMPLCGDRPAIG